MIAAEQAGLAACILFKFDSALTGNTTGERLSAMFQVVQQLNLQVGAGSGPQWEPPKLRTAI